MVISVLLKGMPRIDSLSCYFSLIWLQSNCRNVIIHGQAYCLFIVTSKVELLLSASFWFPSLYSNNKTFPPLFKPDVRFHKLTHIFHKRLFMPYLLPQVGGDHRRKGIWFRWMGVFHCPVRPSSFPPPHIFSPAHHLLLLPPHLEASRPWDCLFMPRRHYLSELSTLPCIPAYSFYFRVANTSSMRSFKD